MSSDPSGRKGYRRIALLIGPCPVLYIRHHKPIGIRYTASVLGRMREVPMRDERLEVSVTFVPAKGYVASAPELKAPVTALSLGGLRRRIEALMMPDDLHVVLQLDRTAIPVLASGEILADVSISMTRILVGFLTGSLVGVVMGVLLGRIRPLHDLLDPIIELLRSLSPTAMIPIAVIWFGIGEMSKYFLIFWGTFFIVLVNTTGGVSRGADRRHA